MATVSDTIQVSGVRCERCVAGLAGTLRAHEGIEAANANLMGLVALSWDDEQTTREAILETLSRGGFPSSSRSERGIGARRRAFSAPYDRLLGWPGE